ncbi:hypothetical protein HYS54_02715 [Candidatus Micrarchaeota archaeon]|nr:hypothetical protein [Candidatus Micrarchaeota archaeon]
MKAKITAIEQKQTQAGEPFWRLNLEDHWFSLFDAESAKSVKEGDWIEFAWSENDRFKKIRSLTKVNN